MSLKIADENFTRPIVFQHDLEILILMYEDGIIHSEVEAKWRIGQRIAWEEVLLRSHGIMDMETRKDVFSYLEERFGNEYSYIMMNRYCQFYLSHLNLFDSSLHFDDDILSWESYMMFMKIDDEHVRLIMEEEAISQHWSKSKMKKMILREMDRSGRKKDSDMISESTR